MIRVVGVVLVISWVLLGLPETTPLDVWVHSVLPHVDWLRAMARGISFVLSPGLAALFGIGLAVLAWRRRDVRPLLLFALCWSTLLSRYLFRRVRPIDYPQWAYPSGHTVAVAAVAFTLVVLLGRGVLLALLAVLLTGACRVVLEMHWVTDTIGSVLGVAGVGLLVANALGLVASWGDLVPYFAGPRRRP